MERTPVDELELKVAIAASEERQRHDVKETLTEFKQDVRRDLRLYVGLGVACGNAVAAVAIQMLGPSNSIPSAAHAARQFLGL